jgi:RNA polymerase subunit RPABC4/transcription elongation factor Spt4
MSGYKKPCRYCDALIPPESNVCPVCGKVNPIGPPRCPKCRTPIQKGWKSCSNCGLALEVKCPKCRKQTFFGDYCEHCSAPLAGLLAKQKAK